MAARRRMKTSRTVRAVQTRREDLMKRLERLELQETVARARDKLRAMRGRK